MLRDEAYYFLPQRMTKIMNEGWASFWHSRLMTGGAAATTPRSSTSPASTPARRAATTGR